MRMSNVGCAIGLVMLSCLGIAGCPQTESAQTLTGKWVGTASSSSGPLYYEWNLVQTGNAVAGTIYLATQDRAYYGRYAVTGTVDGNTLTYLGGSFDQNVPPPGGSWCAASGTLLLTSGANDSLTGGWSCAGANGQVSLERQ